MPIAHTVVNGIFQLFIGNFSIVDVEVVLYMHVWSDEANRVKVQNTTL